METFHKSLLLEPGLSRESSSMIKPLGSSKISINLSVEWPEVEGVVPSKHSVTETTVLKVTSNLTTSSVMSRGLGVLSEVLEADSQEVSRADFITEKEMQVARNSSEEEGVEQPNLIIMGGTTSLETLEMMNLDLSEISMLPQEQEEIEDATMMMKCLSSTKILPLLLRIK